MRKAVWLAAGVFAFSVCCHAASAARCPKCENVFVTPPEGKCKSCGKGTDSGALKLCPACSAERKQCEICEVKVEGQTVPPAEKPAASDPPATKVEPSVTPANPPPLETAPVERAPEKLPAEVPGEAAPLANPQPTPIESLPAAEPRAQPPSTRAPLDANKPGTYTSGLWQYRLEFTDAGTRSEGRWGWLTYQGQKLPRGEVNDYYLTPWGPIYWVDVPKNRWGLHGWMTSPSPQANRRGRALNAPAAPANPAAAAKPDQAVAAKQPQAAAGPRQPAPARAPQTLQLTKADSGKRAKVYVGNVIVVRLPGNPTTGYQWQAAAMNSPALRLAGAPQFARADQAGNKAGAGGTYVFQFSAMRAGTATIRLTYARPWERTKAPAETFTLTVDVLAIPAATPPANRVSKPSSSGNTPARTWPASRATTGQSGRVSRLSPQK